MTKSLVNAAKSLAPMILANLDRIDSDCQLPPELAATMAQENLFSLYAPKCFRRTRIRPNYRLPCGGRDFQGRRLCRVVLVHWKFFLVRGYPGNHRSGEGIIWRSAGYKGIRFRSA